MERWEKEYLEAIGKDGSSKKPSKGAGRGAKIGLSVFCLAVVCGIALLVWMGSTAPRQPLSDVLSGNEISSLSSSSNSPSIASGGTIKHETTTNTGSPSGTRDSAQTYIDGIGFCNMMTVIEELTDIESRMNSDLSATNFSPDAAAIQGYKTEIASWQKKVQSLSYHKSYQDLMQRTVNEATAMDELLDCIDQNAGVNTINRCTQSLNGLHEAERDALLSAFETNNINYTVAPDGSFSYTYKQY